MVTSATPKTNIKWRRTPAIKPRHCFFCSCFPTEVIGSFPMASQLPVVTIPRGVTLSSSHHFLANQVTYLVVPEVNHLKNCVPIPEGLSLHHPDHKIRPSTLQWPHVPILSSTSGVVAAEQRVTDPWSLSSPVTTSSIQYTTRIRLLHIFIATHGQSKNFRSNSSSSSKSCILPKKKKIGHPVSSSSFFGTTKNQPVFGSPKKYP